MCDHACYSCRHVAPGGSVLDTAQTKDSDSTEHTKNCNNYLYNLMPGMVEDAKVCFDCSVNVCNAKLVFCPDHNTITFAFTIAPGAICSTAKRFTAGVKRFGTHLVYLPHQCYIKVSAAQQPTVVTWTWLLVHSRCRGIIRRPNPMRQFTACVVATSGDERHSCTCQGSALHLNAT